MKKLNKQFLRRFFRNKICELRFLPKKTPKAHKQLYLQVFKKDNSSRYHTFAFFDPISSNQTMLYYYNIRIDNQNLVIVGGYNQNNYIDHYKLYDSNINEINKIISNQKYILDIYTCDTVLSASAYDSDGNQLESLIKHGIYNY